MQPTRFLETAELLNRYREELHVRSSISRSYYAVHLFLRDYLSKHFLNGGKIKRNPHQFVIDCLQYCSVKDIKKLGIKLDCLRQSRTDADYRLEKTLSRKDSEDTLAKARQMLIVASAIGGGELKERIAESTIEQARRVGMILE